MLAKKLRAVWEPFGALGRVYVASEGINAQMALPATVFDNFAAACECVWPFVCVSETWML